MAVALRILREPALAEDLLQEAFVNIWHHAGSYAAAKAKPQTWLTSIVRNRCLDQLRRREPDTVTMTRDEDEAEMEFAAMGPTPEELLLSGADANSVRACVEGLEGGQKQAIALAFCPGALARRARAASAPAARHGEILGAPRPGTAAQVPRRRGLRPLIAPR